MEKIPEERFSAGEFVNCMLSFEEELINLIMAKYDFSESFAKYLFTPIRTIFQSENIFMRIGTTNIDIALAIVLDIVDSIVNAKEEENIYYNYSICIYYG